MLVVSLSFTFPAYGYFFRRYASVFAKKIVTKSRGVGVDDFFGVFEKFQLGGTCELRLRVDPRLDAQKVGRQTSVERVVEERESERGTDGRRKVSVKDRHGKTRKDEDGMTRTTMTERKRRH